MGEQLCIGNGEIIENLATENLSAAFLLAGGKSCSPKNRTQNSPFAHRLTFISMDNKGWILVWRKIIDTSFYKDSYALHLALHLLLRANHIEKKILFNKKDLIIKRGQVCCGRYTLAEETGIKPSTVRDKLQLLKNIGFLDIKSNNKFSIVTIINYEGYQNNKEQLRQQTRQQPDNRLPATRQQPDTNNTLKNDKNDKNVIIEDIQEFFNYFLLKTKKDFKLTPERVKLIENRIKDGFTLEQLKSAVDNFVQDDWEERQAHLDLIYCIGKQKGKPDHLEKWLNYKPKEQLTEIQKFIRKE